MIIAKKLGKIDNQQWLAALIIILMAETLAIVGFTSSMPIIPFYIQTKFGITNPNEVKIWDGLLNAVPTLILAFFAPIWGALADSRGRKAMLVRALIGGGFSIGLMFFAQNIYQLFILRMIQGATTGSIAAANVLVLSIVPFRHSAISLAILQIGIFIGTALGPLFGGWSFDNWGGQTNFLVSATLILTGCITVLLTIKEPPLDNKDAAGHIKKIRWIPDFSILKKHHSITFLICAMFFSQMAIALVNTQLGLFVAELNANPSTIGSVTGMVFASGAVSASAGALFFGYLSKKVPLQVCFITSLAGAAVGYFPQAFSTSWHFLLMIKLIDSFFIGGIIPVFNAILNILAPEKQRGAIFGISSSVSFMGSAFGPFIGSGIAVSFGTSGNRVIFIFGTIILGGILLTALARKTYWQDLNREVKEKLRQSSEKNQSKEAESETPPMAD